MMAIVHDFNRVVAYAPDDDYTFSWLENIFRFSAIELPVQKECLVIVVS